MIFHMKELVSTYHLMHLKHFHPNRKLSLNVNGILASSGVPASLYGVLKAEGSELKRLGRKDSFNHTLFCDYPPTKSQGEISRSIRVNYLPTLPVQTSHLSANLHVHKAAAPSSYRLVNSIHWNEYRDTDDQSGEYHQ